MNLTKERQGEVIIIAEALLWSLFPVITILSLTNLSPIVSFGWSTLFATLFFAIMLTIKGKWREIKNREAIKDILLVTFFIGILFYLFYFLGLSYTSAGNASLIALTEVFFSFLLFHVWRKDYISPNHIIGAILILAGAMIILYPNFSEFHLGDLLILAGAFVAPFGNFFQQRARTKVGSESILFIRSFISVIVIFFIAYLSNLNFLPTTNSEKTFIILIINGFFLLGLSKILWIEGIHKISVTKAIALNGITPLLTLLFAWLLLDNIPTHFQLLSFVPMFLGVIFLSKNK